MRLSAEVQKCLCDDLMENATAQVAIEKDIQGKDVATLAEGSSIALVGRLGGRGIRLVVDIVLARVLGPATFGLYAIGWTITRMLSLVSPLGLEQGVIRFASRHWRKNDASLKGVVLQSLTLSVISGLMIGAGFYFSAPWLGEGIFHQPSLTPIIRCFAFVLPLMNVLKVAASATRVSQLMKFSVYAEDVSQPAVNLLLILVFYLLGRGLVGALAACVYSFGVAAILAVQYVRQVFPEAASARIRPSFAGKQLLTFSLPASLSGMFGILLIWADRLFVGYYRPATEVGFYHAASQLSIGLAVILGAFGSIFSPMTADLHQRGEIGRLEELFRVSTKWALYLSLPPFLVMCFAPRQVMTVLFGPSYGVGASALVILALGQVVNAATGPVGVLLVMTGYQNHMFLISGAMLLSNIALNLILVPVWGMSGAAAATALALSGVFISAVLLARHALKIWPYDRRYLKGLVATFFSAGALLLVRSSTLGGPAFHLLLNLVITTTVFAVTLIVSGLDAEDREFLNLLRARLR